MQTKAVVAAVLVVALGVSFAGGLLFWAWFSNRVPTYPVGTQTTPVAQGQRNKPSLRSEEAVGLQKRMDALQLQLVDLDRQKEKYIDRVAAVEGDIDQLKARLKEADGPGGEREFQELKDQIRFRSEDLAASRQELAAFSSSMETQRARLKQMEAELEKLDVEAELEKPLGRRAHDDMARLQDQLDEFQNEVAERKEMIDALPDPKRNP